MVGCLVGVNKLCFSSKGVLDQIFEGCWRPVWLAKQSGLFVKYRRLTAVKACVVMRCNIGQDGRFLLNSDWTTVKIKRSHVFWQWHLANLSHVKLSTELFYFTKAEFSVGADFVKAHVVVAQFVFFWVYMLLPLVRQVTCSWLRSVIWFAENMLEWREVVGWRLGHANRRVHEQGVAPTVST